MTATGRDEAVQALKELVRPARDEVRRRSKRTAARGALRRLQRRNRHSTDPVVGDAPVVVSLTSFGPRIDTVAWAIESIGLGDVLPGRLILWLDDLDRLANPPEPLARLAARGLELLPTPDHGPHKKYLPYVRSVAAHSVPLVTADDDIIYPRHWLRELIATYDRHPHQVSCYRANVVVTGPEGLAPYTSWPRCRTSAPSLAHMATGVSGVLYPPELLDALRERGEEFLTSCPRADDIWLHWVALQQGVPVGQVRPRPRHFMAVPGTQDTSLTAFNVHAGGNDQQIAAVYSASDVERLRAARDAVARSS